VERQNVEQMKRHMAKMKRKAHKEALKHEKRREKTLARLAHRTAMTKMQGNHIGVFGLTSTGKSTMINSLLGKKAADIGVGETTKQKTSYQGRNCIYWDTPGRNDESTYTNEEYISFIKGLTRRLIIVQYTIKENLKLIRLLDNLGLGYDIIVNKFDDVDQNEQSKFKQQIKDEINSFGLERMKKVFFLSAQYPKMFADWLTMVNYLSEPSTDCMFKHFTKEFIFNFYFSI
jgi:small GTP-binding protein